MTNTNLKKSTKYMASAPQNHEGHKKQGQTEKQDQKRLMRHDD